MIALALFLSVCARAEKAERVFAAGSRVALVSSDTVRFLALPEDSTVRVSGRSAFGPLAESGDVEVSPAARPDRWKEFRFTRPLRRPVLPERNGSRFLLCTVDDAPAHAAQAGEGPVFDSFCGVVGIDSLIVFKTPAPPAGTSYDGLALSSDGRQALFEVRRGKDIESYVVWTEGAKAARSYKADVKDMELRRVLNRFGLNDWNPEPERKPKPGAHNP